MCSSGFSLAIKTSSMYEKKNGNLRVTEPRGISARTVLVISVGLVGITSLVVSLEVILFGIKFSTNVARMQELTGIACTRNT